MQTKASNKDIDLCADTGLLPHTTNRVRGNIINSHIAHLWYDKEINMDVEWSGRIAAKEDMLVEKPLLTILYWKSEKSLIYMAACVYHHFNYIATYYFCEDVVFVIFMNVLFIFVWLLYVITRFIYIVL